MATKGEKEMPEDNEELVDESKSSDDASGGYVTFWDSKLTQVKAVRDIQLRDDERVPSITGMCMLDNEEIVLCDNANNKVKFLNNISTTVKYDIQCKAAPFDVARFDDKSVVATMPEDKKLQFVIVKPGAKLDKTIIVPGKCYGINIHENTIYICMLEEGVCILSDNGTKQKRIPYESTGIPKYICITSDAKRICYAGGDEKSAFVSFMTNDGYGLKKCTDGIQIPAGLSLDKENNILLLDSGANKIYVIHNNDGNKQCLLSKNAKKYNFTSMLFNIQTRKLVVACSGKTPVDKRNTRHSSTQGKEEKEKEKPVSKVKIYQLGAQPNRMWDMFDSFKKRLWKW